MFALKVLLERLDASLAGEALLFDINYSICFILIYLTGSMLAHEAAGDDGQHHRAHEQRDVGATFS